MQRLRTEKFKLLLFIFGVYAIPSFASTLDTFSQAENNTTGIGKITHDKAYNVRVTDVKILPNDKNDFLITYQPINQGASKAISDSHDDSRFFEIVFDNIGADFQKTFNVISTFSNDSCRENSTTQLPAWKIDKSVGEKFRIEINQVKHLARKTLYLCVFNDSSGQFEHLGQHSRLEIAG